MIPSNGEEKEEEEEKKERRILAPRKTMIHPALTRCQEGGTKREREREWIKAYKGERCQVRA